MQQINCPIDNKKNFSSLTEFYFDQDVFTLVKCRECGLVLINPQPEQELLNKYYPAEYYGKNNEKFVKFIQLLRRISVEKKIRKIQKLYKEKAGTVMDIGCADGAFLFNIKKRRWNTVGLELSQSFKNNKNFKEIKVLVGDIGSHNLEKNNFDVITLWHVFEHLREPNKYLGIINKLMRQNGLLVLTLPNIESWQSKIFGKYWFHLDIPRHLFHYSPKTLKNLLNKHSFKIQKIEHFSLEYNPFGFIQSLYNFIFKKNNIFYEALKNYNSKVMKKYPFQTIFSFILLSILLAPALVLSAIEAMFKKGGTIKVYIRKKSS